jgi:bud site selection protein 31
VINPSKFKFGTTSICRVPLFDRSADARAAQDPTTGCRGCASGKGAGPKNIFGNKYGQHLAAVQIAREKRMEELERKQREKEEREKAEKADDDGEDETDDEDDYGPTPAAGVWAGSQRLKAESEAINQGNDDDGEEETDDDEDGPMPAKKQRTN